MGNIIMFSDGFIDEVWEPVDSRASLTEYKTVGKMTQFGQRIMDVGSGGMGIELVKKRRNYGGFCANIGCATAKLGIKTTMVGLFGNGQIDPVFAPVEKVARMITIGDAAVTHILEFDDGKIMMTHMSAAMEIDWTRLVNELGTAKIVELITEADIIGIGYWSILADFDNIVTQICANMPQDGKQRRLFFDFADVRKRDVESLRQTFECLKAIKIPTILSVNEHEGADIFVLCNETLDDTGRSIPEKTEDVRSKLGLTELVIHTPHYAAAASATEKAAIVSQNFCEKPVRTTGAGDTFNGGYLSALLAGSCIEERLRAANTAVSYFLNTGQVPELEQNILK